MRLILLYYTRSRSSVQLLTVEMFFDFQVLNPDYLQRKRKPWDLKRNKFRGLDSEHMRSYLADLYSCKTSQVDRGGTPHRAPIQTGAGDLVAVELLGIRGTSETARGYVPTPWGGGCWVYVGAVGEAVGRVGTSRKNSGYVKVMERGYCLLLFIVSYLLLDFCLFSAFCSIHCLFDAMLFV